jgi:Fe-S oxidoreductase
MDVCPVTKGSFTIDELNSASKKDSEVPADIKDFAFHCVQCGKCVPVCPMNIHRDYMVRYIKFKLREQKPWTYKRYLFIKGPNHGALPRFAQKLYTSLNKVTTRDLACFMENTALEQADVLFYPGCYIYSTTTVRQTLRLLDHIGCSYSVLGGVTSCCGAPHLLQGEFDQADHCLESLHNTIKAVNPKTVITACAECFEAVTQIKTIYNEDFEVLSVVQYLLKNKEKFPMVKTRGKIIVHDSCRFNRQTPQATAARHTVSLFGELVEKNDTKEASCCYQWNHGSDKNNRSRRLAYLSETHRLAPTMACTCLTCYEELQKHKADLEVIDVQSLFEESLNNLSTKER